MQKIYRIKTEGCSHTLLLSTFVPDEKYWLSKFTEPFAADLLKYPYSILAMTAPSAIFNLRFIPHLWLATYNVFRFLDREAVLHICPLTCR